MRFSTFNFEENTRTIEDEYENCVENVNCFHINRLPARCNLVPAQKSGVYYSNKEESNMLLSLNGNYRFKYCTNDTEHYFYKEDYNDSDWDHIDVPSMWQYRGYGQCSYPNVRYPIPFNPPYVDCENPVGYYRREFILDEIPDNAILHFGGVDNCFFVYINSNFVGFSKGSRIPAEFNVTKYLKRGCNSLCVKVFTYSDSTYVENQDMLTASGIFRDVYLLMLGKVYVSDMHIVPNNNDICIEVTLNTDECSGYGIRMSVDGQSTVVMAKQKIFHTFTIPNSKMWNAEEPNLYTVIIEIFTKEKTIEVHSKRVGFVRTEVVGNKLLVNGSPIYIKGINRHEYDCRNGRSITAIQIRKELTLIKQNNFNAIRCSHYTNNPAFYEIASELGLYVMDEADLETHGCNEAGDQGYLSKKPEWLGVYLDRVSRMYELQKNESCVIMWSIGNECGRGKNIEICEEYLRNKDNNRVILSAQKTEDSPFRVLAYCSMERLRNGSEPVSGCPVLLVEYAHAMGNSPGGLKDYWDFIYSNEQVVGGFVWEFKNHGFYCEDESGKPFYKYGGDFKDDYSTWMNFCLDGFLTSDGSPKPVWYEAREALAPVYVTYDGNIKIKNTNGFLDLSYLKVQWELCEDYHVLESGTMKMPAIKPSETGILDIALTVEPVPGACYRLNLSFFDGNRMVSKKQINLPFAAESIKRKKDNFEAEIKGDHHVLSVSGTDFEIVIKEGMLASYINNGKEILSGQMKLNFYRAPIDNDGVYGLIKRHIGEWENAYLEYFKFHMREIEVKKEDSAIVIKVKGKATARAKYVGFDIDVKYEILKSGFVTIVIEGKPYGEIPTILPRIGVVFEVDKKVSGVSWYGRGPLQSYSDAKLAAIYGLYSSDVDHINFLFDYPQETGNHENTRFVRLSNGLSAIGSKEFAFSYHPFDQKTLTNARHLNELVEAEHNYLYLDYKMRPLGSRSCGPDPEPQYELFAHDFRFAFALCASDSEEKLLDEARSDLGVCTKALSEKYVFKKAERFEIENAECDVE